MVERSTKRAREKERDRERGREREGGGRGGEYKLTASLVKYYGEYPLPLSSCKFVQSQL